MLAPLRDSRDEVRKRFIAPRVRMSSVEILNPEAGAIGDEERRRKGLNSFLGDVQVVELRFFLERVGELLVGVASSYESGRVVQEVLMEASPPDEVGLRVEPLKHDEEEDGDLDMSVGGEGDDNDDGEEYTVLDVASEAHESNLAEIKSPSTPGMIPMRDSSAPSDSRALGSGRGAKRILRALGIELLRVPGRVCTGVAVPLTDWEPD
jgi:hypothetical protein